MPGEGTRAPFRGVGQGMSPPAGPSFAGLRATRWCSIMAPAEGRAPYPGSRAKRVHDAGCPCLVPGQTHHDVNTSCPPSPPARQGRSLCVAGLRVR